MLYPGSSFRMTDDLLEEYIRQYIKRQLTVMIKSELVFKKGIDESTYGLVAATT